MKVAYLASPYSDSSRAVMDWRLDLVHYVVAKFFRNGVFLYSPISYTAPMTKYKLPYDYKFWKEFDHELIRRSDKLIVFMLDGWEASIGVQDEIAYAKEIGKPIEFMELYERIYD